MNYKRDKRSPKPKNENVSRVMSANKNKNTIPEVILRKALWKEGFRGFRIHYNKLPGKPDIVFVSKKVAVFVNGCFWHRCPHCNYSLPKNNTLFWKNKFEKNIERDKVKIDTLKMMGWKPIVIWECELKTNMKNCLNKIQKIVTVYGKQKIQKKA